MILHVVGVTLAPGVQAAALANVMDGLAGLQAGFDGWLAFRHGRNLDMEGLSPDIDYGFVCRFADVDALGRYAEDPTHKALGRKLVSLCKGGKSGIFVMDLTVEGEGS